MNTKTVCHILLFLILEDKTHSENRDHKAQISIIWKRKVQVGTLDCVSVWTAKGWILHSIAISCIAVAEDQGAGPSCSFLVPWCLAVFSEPCFAFNLKYLCLVSQRNCLLLLRNVMLGITSILFNFNSVFTCHPMSALKRTYHCFKFPTPQPSINVEIPSRNHLSNDHPCFSLGKKCALRARLLL